MEFTFGKRQPIEPPARFVPSPQFQMAWAARQQEKRHEQFIAHLVRTGRFNEGDRDAR